MKKIALIAALCAVSFAVSAQTSPATNNVTVHGPALKSIDSNNTYPMDSADFYQFKGSYNLANGDVLSLFNRGDLMFAKLDGQKWHRIVATGANTFVAVDKQLMMRIERHDNDDVSGEVLISASPDQIAKNGTSSDGYVSVAFR